jgi:hypothetical protein
MNEGERRPAMFSIDREIGIQRQDRVPFMDFCHGYNTRVGERHRRVAIFFQQLAQKTHMLGDPGADAECAILQELE